jgi:ribosomal protein S18 acetylase RimI-like enzyme
MRRTLRRTDAAAIQNLHRALYCSEYGLNEAFVDGVRRNVEAAMATGWPSAHGGVWLIDASEPGKLAGALALTRELPAALGRVRWFALAPELRGQGLGRGMLQELLREARQQGIARLELETFSALTAAAHLYRDAGFEVTRSEERDDWGAAITLQHYALDL